MLSDFDLAVFDIAGTTVEEHSAVYVALEGAVRAGGAEPSVADIQCWMGADKTEAITALLPGQPSADEVRGVFADFKERLHLAYAEHPPSPLPGVEAAFATLRRGGVRVVLTTGFSKDVTEEVLRLVGWTVGEQFDDVICAEEVGAGRPAPYMIFEAMRRTRVHDVRRVLVAGDTVLDLLAGSNAGAGAVFGVLTGAMDEAALSATPSSGVLAGVASIPALLARP